MPDLSITIEIWRKGNWFLATAPELDFMSQGKTFEEAKKNLLEIIKIQFDEMKEMRTLEDYLAESGFRQGRSDPTSERNRGVRKVRCDDGLRYEQAAAQRL